MEPAVPGAVRSSGGLPWRELAKRLGDLLALFAAHRFEGHALHRARQRRERLTAGTEWVDCDLLFARENGTAIDPKEDLRAWKQRLTDAGVRDARLHDARHTAATIMLTMGVPARVVMQVLGHSQITLTLGSYSQVAPELAAEAAERVGRCHWHTLAHRSTLERSWNRQSRRPEA